MSSKKLSSSQQQFNLLVAKALFFSTAMSSVGWQRFQNNYYLDKGFSSYEIGTLKSFGLLFKFIGEPFWCFIADLTDPKLVFIGCLVTSVATMEMLRVPKTLTYSWVLLVKFLRTLTAPASTLTTAASFKLTEGTNEGYGRQRMYGSLAWGSGAFITGFLIDLYGMAALFLYTYFFIAVNFCCVMYGLPSRSAKQQVDDSPPVRSRGSYFPSSPKASSSTSESSLPTFSPASRSYTELTPASLITNGVPPPVQEVSPSSNASIGTIIFSGCSNTFANLRGATSSYFNDMRQFLSNYASRIILINTFVYGSCMTIIDTFMFVSLEKDFGASRTFSGLCTTTSIVSCLPVFYYSDYLIHKHGHIKLLLVAEWACVLRLLLFSTIEPGNPNAYALILGVQLIHGLNFALFWGAVVDALFKLAPRDLTSSCLSALNVMYFTLSGSFGNLIWGYLYERYGLQFVYYCGASVMVLMLLVFQLYEPVLTTILCSKQSDVFEEPESGMWVPESEESPVGNGRNRFHHSSLIV